MSSLGLYLACWLALLVDHRLGEPAVRWHPVVWMGNYLGWAGTAVQRHALQDLQRRDLRTFWHGAGAWCLGAAGVVLVAWLLQTALQQLPWWAGLLGLGLLLKPLLAWAMLQSEVQAVQAALQQSLPAGRARLAYLVSRDVTQLSANQVRESAIETLAENLNDSVVAPLFWFALAGLPGAALYRFANTADAMWGYPGVYQGRNWAWAGKWAARVDDGLSYVPARITALVLVVTGRMQGLCSWRVLDHLPAEAARTPSPNSGWPMAAMALVLGVGLGKPGVYSLNAQGAQPEVTHVQQALRVGHWALLLFALLGCALALWLGQCLRAWVEVVQLFAATGVQA